MPKSNPYYRGPRSDHFDGLRFFNPGEAATDRGFRDVLRWKTARRPAKWLREVHVVPTVPPPVVDGVRVTMIGHATLLVQIAGVNILTDPVWSRRASPLSFAGPARVTAPGICFDDLPPIHLVLLSHNHYDHLDVVTLKRLHEQHRPIVITPLGNDTIVQRNVPGTNLAMADWWDSIDVAGITFKIVPANHWSSRTATDRRMALWWVRDQDTEFRVHLLRGGHRIRQRASLSPHSRAMRTYRYRAYSHRRLCS